MGKETGKPVGGGERQAGTKVEGHMGWRETHTQAGRQTRRKKDRGRNAHTRARAHANKQAKHSTCF